LKHGDYISVMSTDEESGNEGWGVFIASLKDRRKYEGRKEREAAQRREAEELAARQTAERELALEAERARAAEAAEMRAKHEAERKAADERARETEERERVEAEARREERVAEAARWIERIEFKYLHYRDVQNCSPPVDVLLRGANGMPNLKKAWLGMQKTLSPDNLPERIYKRAIEALKILNGAYTEYTGSRSSGLNW
jgi:hypothetical protein